MTLNQMKQRAEVAKARARAHAGYTIDQTILIVAIIAILITLIILSVGWDLINRAGGAKLAAQLRQIEDSVGQFYSEYNRFPHTAITGLTATDTPAAAITIMYALTGGGTYVSSIPAGVPNYVQGFGDDGARVTHGFGTGADPIGLAFAPSPNSNGNYLIAMFQNVPVDEVLEADEAIDGDIDAVAGRVFYVDGAAGDCIGGGAAAAAGTTDAKTVCYLANRVD